MIRHLDRRLLAAEAGFILPTAIMIMLILALLMGAAIAVSTQTSRSTTRDDNAKVALEAAEAGLQVASYRLSQLKPAKTQCATGSVNETPSTLPTPKITFCKASPEEPLGNGATFSYRTSLPLEAAMSCAGSVGEVKAGYTPRCVVAEAKIGDVSQRLMTRIESKAGASLFSVKGIVGLSEVKISGSVKIPAVVASNEKIIGEGSAAFERGYELCPPKGSFKPAAGSERNASGVTVGGIGGMKANPPLEITRTSGCPLTALIPATHAATINNEDSRIGVSDKLEGTTTWNAANYELTLASNGKLTLAGSKYYLCNFKATNNSRLKIAATAKVEIFVDSPEDPGSPCKAGTGKFEGEGEFIVENEAKDPAALLIVLYGKGPFVLKNGSSLEGSIYAPNAEVKIPGGSKFKGGIVGNIVRIENGTGVFEWSEGVSSLTNGVVTGYARKAWGQCAPGSDPNEGC